MVDVMLHLRGREPEPWTLEALPRAGDFIDVDGTLWRVDAIVFGGDQVDVYCIQVAETRAAELRAEWAAWGDTPPEGEQEAEQTEMFQ